MMSPIVGKADDNILRKLTTALLPGGPAEQCRQPLMTKDRRRDHTDFTAG